jgi:hypothetical protein
MQTFSPGLAEVILISVAMLTIYNRALAGGIDIRSLDHRRQFPNTSGLASKKRFELPYAVTAVPSIR